jgi:hypothetical protein
MTTGALFCSACHGSELTDSKRPRCAHCGCRRILTAGTLRAAIIGYHRGKMRDALAEAVKRLLLESGATALR